MIQQSVPTGWERVATAIERVRQRLLKVTRLLNESGIPYAVSGGNAVAEWVGRVDEAAVRFTKDVDILIRRADLPALKAVLEPAGFVYHEFHGVSMFLDGPDSTPKDAVHLLFAGEKVRPESLVAAPDVFESEDTRDFSVLQLDALIRMKLTAFRRKDQVHVLDMLDVGLLDASWRNRLPPELASRFQTLLDTPDG